jgi:outer membrane cobalamin receptor
VATRRRHSRSRLSVSVGWPIAAATLALLWPAVLTAATLRGLTLDPQGRPVPGVRIQAEGPDGRRTAQSDDAGRFVLADLPPGRYRVGVEHDAFRAPVREIRLADDPAPVDVAITMDLSGLTERVVVSAAQVDLPRASVPASVTVLSEAEVRARQADSLTMALRGVAGLTVAESGSRGALTSIFPRGGESDYTLVLVDGVQVNSFGGGLDLAMLGAVGADQVEVVRGPQSAVYGADAIGAVVSVVSRTPDRLSASGLVEAGTHDTARVAGAAAGTAGRWTWSGGAERAASDNFNGEPYAPWPRIGNDDVVRTGGAGSGGYVSPRLQVRASVRGGGSERGYPGPFGSDPNGTYGGIDLVSRGNNRWLGAGARAEVRVSPRLAIAASGSWYDLDSDFTSPYGPSESGTRRSTARVRADVTLAPALQLSAGVDALEERAHSTFITGAAFQPVPISRGTFGAYAEVRAEFGDRWFVTGGLRADRLTRDALEGDPFGFVPRPPFAADTQMSVNPKFALSGFLRRPDSGGWTRMRASAGTGIRPPDAFEIAFTDNPALAPERSRSVEAGIEHAMLGGALVLDTAWFLNRYDDLIVAVGPAFGDLSRYRTDNIANAGSSGVEVTVSGRFGSWLQLRGAYTWLHTEVLAVDGGSGAAPPPFTAGDPLVRRPRHEGALTATLASGRWSAFGQVRARGEWLDVDPTYGALGGTLVAPGFAVADLGAGVRIAGPAEAFARVLNLLDRGVEETLGFPALGRSVIAGVRVAAGR